MTQTPDWSFETQNAKRMTPVEIARSFVVPPTFKDIVGTDHCYIVGPRGSGKTTLLKMLQGEGLMAWEGAQARSVRSRVSYTSIFLPADDLWASQVHDENARAAFTAQMLYAFIETVQYRQSARDRIGNPVHHPIVLGHQAEVELVTLLANAWELPIQGRSLGAMQAALDLYLLRLTNRRERTTDQFSAATPLSLLNFGIRAVNRLANQPTHRWALLMDEMELAPPRLHREIVSYVRGGAENLILKLSMSPFDRYMETFGVGGAPIPGHDFRAVHLAGQTKSEIRAFTVGLWKEALRAAELDASPIRAALGESAITAPRVTTESRSRHYEALSRAGHEDADFARWLRRRGVDVDHLEDLSYIESSATVRKVYPLVVFRDSVMRLHNGRYEGRPRKKTFDPFTGADALITALEGNPRWIKTVFSDMLRFYDRSTGSVGQGFQFDALVSLANRFESLLHVLPSREHDRNAVPPMWLVDRLAEYFHKQNTGRFQPDPQNNFIVDRRTPAPILDALVMGLYAGAIVHVRDRRSPAVLQTFVGQRFRLAYLLGVRDNREFPMRLGKDVSLTTIVASSLAGRQGARALAPGLTEAQLALFGEVQNDAAN